MKELNLPPFYVGEKIVAIVNADCFKKDIVYTVLGVYKSCCSWNVDIGIILNTSIEVCSFCNKVIAIKGDFAVFDYTCFRSLQKDFIEIEYSEVLKEEKKFVSVN